MIELVTPIRLAEKRTYHDCRADESSDSDDRIRSSRPTVNISASLCSHQSKSQSVAWSHDTLSRNKIRQRLSCEVARHSGVAHERSSVGTANCISIIRFRNLRTPKSSCSRRTKFLLSKEQRRRQRRVDNCSNHRPSDHAV